MEPQIGSGQESDVIFAYRASGKSCMDASFDFLFQVNSTFFQILKLLERVGSKI